MNFLLKNPKFEVKALNLNQFYADVVKELGIKRLSSLELGVIERTHHHDKKRTVTTTQIAAGHEFGNTYTPARPFLSTSANYFVDGDFQEDVKQEYTYLGAFLKRLAKKLYKTVIDCFTSDGFGSWLPLTERYKQRTGRVEPALIDTGKLLSSVYVKYEGYTISGKTTGGRISSDSFFVENDTKKDVPKSTKSVKQGTKISKPIIKVNTEKETQKTALEAIYSKAKEKEMTHEQAVEKVIKTMKTRFKNDKHAFEKWWLYSEEAANLENMSVAEIRKRFGI